MSDSGHTLKRVNPRLSDVAAVAGVSPGTVSHVLNHPERVRPETRVRVEEAITRLGFVRNANAGSLAGGVNRTVGLVLIDIGNSLFVDIARGAQRTVGHDSMSLLLANSDNDDDLQGRHLKFFTSTRAAGVLLAPMRDPSVQLRPVERMGIPVVLLNYRHDDYDHCSVLIDNEGAGYIAAKHMLDLGRRELLFIGGPKALQPVADRQRGIRRAVDEVGGATLREWSGDLTVDQAEAAISAHFLGRSQRPDAVIAVTDLLGMATVRALGQRGFAVPEDVAVMGCDSNSHAWGGAISLTTVRMRGEDMGASGIALLAEETDAPDQHEHRRIVLTPSLLARESTLGPAAHEADLPLPASNRSS